MTMTDIDTSVLEELDQDMKPPCEGPCRDGIPEWVFTVRKHEPCDDGTPLIRLTCTPCKNLALDPETILICTYCDVARPAAPYIISIDPM